MESTLLEIVELDDGDIVLQRADGEGGPLINIRFSDKTRAYSTQVGRQLLEGSAWEGC